MKKYVTLFFFFLFVLMMACQTKIKSPEIKINFSHLQHLTETIKLNGANVDIVHIYADHPGYEWIDAASEGITCIDDVARAAMVYLRYFELYNDSTVLSKARQLLRFVMDMQTDDGDFYNFLLPDLTINTEHKNSQKSFNFWAARGYWALGAGYKTFKSIDANFAHQLKFAFLKNKTPIQKVLLKYNQTITSNGLLYPTWLLNEVGSDATAEFLLGLAAFLSVEKDTFLIAAARKFCQGIIMMQIKNEHKYSGAFLSWENIWHGWGNSQMQALAELYPLLEDDSILRAIKKEADMFISKMMVDGRIREIELPDKITIFPQIAYSIRCEAVGLLRLYKITKQKKYAQLAGLVASWLTGNNAAKMPMYDSASGRVFDGINDSTSINKNSGAESTIEGLFTLVEILHHPIARNYINYKQIFGKKSGTASIHDSTKNVIFENSQNDKLILQYNLLSRNFEIIKLIKP